MRRASALIRQKELTMRAGIDGRAVLFALLVGSAVIACNPGAATNTGSPAPTTAASPTPTTAVATLQATVQPTPTTSPSPVASATTSPSPLGGLGGSGTPQPVGIDPCTLLTTDQASALNGVTYPAGVSHQLDNGAAECVWQTSTPHSSVVVQVIQALNVTDADIAWAEAKAQISGATVENLTGVGDKAAIVRAAGQGLSTGGIYVVDGSTVFDIVYLNGTVPTDDQLTADATIILGELP